MKFYKIYRNEQIESVSYTEYKKWLLANSTLYFIGPHMTNDNREIYTAFTANVLESSCFTTFEVFLDRAVTGQSDNIYESPDWVSAREIHKKLLNVNPKIEEGIIQTKNKNIFQYKEFAKKNVNTGNWHAAKSHVGSSGNYHSVRQGIR